MFVFQNGKAHEQDVDEFGQYIIVNSKFISSEGKIKKFSNKQICPLFKNDVTMVMSDVPNGKAIAKCYLIDKDNNYSLNQRICALRTKENSLFYLYQINRNDYFLKFDDGVKQTNLKKDDVLFCPIYKTSLQEQNKIADFLSLVDKRIEKQRQLVENLKKYKRGLLSAIFERKICFKDDNGNDYPEWKTVTIKDALNYEQPQKYIVETENYSNDYTTPVLTANKAFLLGYTNETEGIYDKGNTIIYDDFTMDFKFVDFKFKVKSSTIKMLTEKENYNLYFMFNLLIYLNLKPQGHQRSYLSILEPMKILCPTFDEQNKIASFLYNIDKKIEHKIEYLQQLEFTKKGLLQQMFI